MTNTDTHNATPTRFVEAHGTTTEETRAVVDAYYQAGDEGHLPSFGTYLDERFSVTAPNYLPWGGTHVGADFFREQVLEHLTETLDFSRFSYENFTVEETHAVALINIGVVGTDDIIKISEHWEVRDGKAKSIWVAYFEPQPLLKLLGITVGGN